MNKRRKTMSIGYCVCCGEPLSAEGTLVCWSCEHNMTKIGKILQSKQATTKEVKAAYADFTNKGE